MAAVHGPAPRSASPSPPSHRSGIELPRTPAPVTMPATTARRPLRCHRDRFHAAPTLPRCRWASHSLRGNTATASRRLRDPSERERATRSRHQPAHHPDQSRTRAPAARPPVHPDLGHDLDVRRERLHRPLARPSGAATGPTPPTTRRRTDSTGRPAPSWTGQPDAPSPGSTTRSPIATSTGSRPTTPYQPSRTASTRDTG